MSLIELLAYELRKCLPPFEGTDYGTNSLHEPILVAELRNELRSRSGYGTNSVRTEGERRKEKTNPIGLQNELTAGSAKPFDSYEPDFLTTQETTAAWVVPVQLPVRH